ncbi:hypothetical protein SAMN05443665_1006242 [Actinomadura meyerae]|uniref:Uncharacterized protein n=1 Tax=Actinomadura meyerae TaxID=240840 RepID=A0A239G0Y6_9ACTN|nr:hypothetical protein SAMN05443665_1006242 [Actinomadura meyerae]
MKCGRVKPLAYPVCAGKGSLNSASAIRQSRFTMGPARPWSGGPSRRGHSLTQSWIRAPVARRGVASVSVPLTPDFPAGAETFVSARITKSES